MKLQLVLVIVILLLFAMPVYASPSLFEHYNVNDDMWATIGAYGGDFWFAQTFTVHQTHTISSVKLLVYRIVSLDAWSGHPGDLVVYIETVDVNGHPSGTILATGTTNANTLPDEYSSSEWREISLSPEVSLDAGVYAIVCHTPTGNDLNEVWWRDDITNPTYNDGQSEFSSNRGGLWTGNSGRDFMFEVYGTDPAVPEYGFLVPFVFLIVAGFAAVLLKRNKEPSPLL